MKQVLVVDDESIIRQWFSMIIEKSGRDFQLAAMAPNGQIALELCQTQRIDIVITDIKMPQMDGLTLIQELRRISSRIKIIILNNYEDFSYAKEALRYGASDYLLKAEIEEDDLLAALEKAKQEIDRADAEQRQISQLLNELNREKSMIRSVFLKQWLGGEIRDCGKIREKLDSFQIDLADRNLFVLVFRIDHSIRLQEQAPEEVNKQLTYAVLSELERILVEEMGNGCIADDAANRFALVVNVKANSLKNTRETLYWFGMKIINEVKSTHQIGLSLGISSFGTGLDSVAQLYKQALDAVEALFFEAECSIVFHGDLLTNKAEHRKDLRQHLECIQDDLEKWKIQGAVHTAEQLLNEIDRHSGYSPKELKQMAAQIARLFVEKARRMGVGLLEPDSDDRLLNEAEQCDFWHTLRDWLRHFLRQAAARIYEEKNTNPVIQQALSYIEAHYARDLTLSEVARHVHLSPAYFSTLFKEQTGENFNQYLIKIRIGKAKRLLNETNLKIGELAEAVGYPNASYFIRVFKKMEGLSPNEYKHMQWKR